MASVHLHVDEHGIGACTCTLYQYGKYHIDNATALQWHYMWRWMHAMCSINRLDYSEK